MTGGRPVGPKTTERGLPPSRMPDGVAGRRGMLALLILLAPVVGCALPGGRATPESSPTEATGPATIRVDNQSGFALTIHAVTQDGHRHRLGSMGSFDTSSFELPASVLSAYTRFQLRADPTGSRTRFDSDPVIIRPGNIVNWTILTDRGRSTVSVESGGG